MVTLTEEQREIRELARAFAEGEIRPHTGRWDEARALDDEVFEKLAELGFMGMLIPADYGGLELDLATYLLILEELAWGDAAVGLSVAIHNGPVARLLLAHGSDEQRSEHLPRLAAGAALGAFALSESGAGSDAASLEARAVRDGNGEGWVLSGTKRWVTNGARADLVVVFARTEAEGAEPAIGAFLVEPSADGYRVGRREKTMGLRASETVEVHLEDVRVDGDALLGEADRGFEYAMEALDLGRAGIAAHCVGIAAAAYEHARGYAQEREQFGRPIADFQAIRFKVADMATRIAAARVLTRQAGAALEAEWAGEAGEADGPGAGALAAMAKLTASETAMWVADEAVQIFGGYGYMRDYPVEKLMRDAKGTEIYEGTSEIMRLVIAREALAGA